MKPGDIFVKMRQCITGLVAAGAGIVEINADVRVAHVVIIFHVLGIEALMGYAVTQEYHGISINQLDFVKQGFVLLGKSRHRQ
jgi:hypothetical protein